MAASGAALLLHATGGWQSGDTDWHVIDAILAQNLSLGAESGKFPVVPAKLAGRGTD